MNRKERRKLKKNPDNANDNARTTDSLLEFAEKSFLAGNAEDAVTIWLRILDKDPHNDKTHNNLGIHFINLRAYDKAIEHLLLATKYGNEASYFYNLGLAYFQLRDFDKSLRAFNKGLTINPRFAIIHNAIGNIFLCINKADLALASFHRAAELDPENGTIASNLGTTLLNRGSFDMAIRQFEKALELDPNQKMAYVHLSTALYKKGFYEEAREILDLAVQLFPKSEILIKTIQGAPIILKNLKQLKEWRSKLVNRLDEILAGPPTIFDQDPREGVEANFYTPYLGGNPRPLLEKIARVFRTCYPKLTYTAAHCKGDSLFPLAKNRRLRVGFISTKCYEHAVTWTFRRLIEATADQPDMEVFLYHIQNTGKMMPTAYRHPNIHAKWVNWPYRIPYPTSDVREHLENDKLDVLVYLDIGMDYMTYLLSFSRIAPVQILMPGHPVSAGVDTIDYFISSEAMESTISDAYFTEKLIRFKSHNVSYERPPVYDTHKRPPRAHYKLPEKGVLYFCIQSLFKVNPVMDESFKQILKRVPGSYLVLVKGTTPGWQRVLERRLEDIFGDDYSRVIWCERMEVRDFFRFITLADVVLDTFPFNGGNTTFQTLSYGKPLVSLKGDYIVNRATYGICSRLGITELVADSIEGYVDIAVKLGLDDAYREDVSKRIQEKAPSLFEQEEPKKEWVSFLRAAANSPEDTKQWIGPTENTEAPAQWVEILHKATSQT